MKRIVAVTLDETEPTWLAEVHLPAWNVACSHCVAAPGSPTTPAGRPIVIFLASSLLVLRLNATQKSRCAPAGASVVADPLHVCPAAIGLATNPVIGTFAALAVPAPSAI